jgi:hypothetical protein
LTEKLVSRIQFEITQIDRLFETYADLFQAAQNRQLNVVEITALASVLHSFYTGIENIFLRLAKDLDESIPAGAQSHRDLLVQMGQATPNRHAVISPEITTKLIDFLSFRHVYRHSYSFSLDWKKMAPLVISMQSVWLEVKSELSSFMTTL